MAHEIEIIEGVAQFAYIGQTPWHGLGNVMPPDANTDEMQKAAGLDWTIKTKPLYFINEAGIATPIEERVVQVRSTDEKVMTVSSAGWVPPQNSDFFAYAQKLASQSGARLTVAGSLREGKTPFALLTLGKTFFVGRKQDQHRNHLLLSWSHMAGRANIMKLVDERVVCANTEAIALRENGATYRQTHSRAFDFDAVHEKLELSLTEIEQQAEDLNKIDGLRMNRFDVVKFLQPLLQPMTPEDLAEANLDEHKLWLRLANGRDQNSSMKGVLASMQVAPGAMPGDDQTGYSVYNGVTHYFDHVVGKSRDARLTSAWFGDRAALKTQVKEGLLALAS
jgi:phage/plasmid-like protein (TIGR03299 family)